MSAFLFAAKCNRVDMIDCLLRHFPTIDPNVVSTDFYSLDFTALQSAVYEHHREMFRRLLRMPGIDVNHRSRRCLPNPLQLAVRHGLVDMTIDLLGVSGISVDVLDLRRNTVLHLAMENLASSCSTLVDLLLRDPRVHSQLNANNNLHETPLKVACRVGSPNVVARLLSEPTVDTNAMTLSWIRTAPLHTAVDWERSYIARKNHWKEGIECTHVDADVRRRHLRVVQQLLADSRVLVNPHDHEGYTPFLRAARRHDVDILGAFVADKRTHINAVTHTKRNALHVALEYETSLSGEAVKLLLALSELRVTERSRGRTALHQAARTSNAEVLQHILDDNRFDPNATDYKGALSSFRHFITLKTALVCAWVIAKCLFMAATCHATNRRCTIQHFECFLHWFSCETVVWQAMGGWCQSSINGKQQGILSIGILQGKCWDSAAGKSWKRRRSEQATFFDISVGNFPKYLRFCSACKSVQNIFTQSRSRFLQW